MRSINLKPNHFKVLLNPFNKCNVLFVKHMETWLKNPIKAAEIIIEINAHRSYT